MISASDHITEAGKKVDDLRIRVAKARGWKNIEPDCNGYLFSWNGNAPYEFPDYPNSMDACMELVEEMTEGTGLFLEIHVSALSDEPAHKNYVALRRFDYDYPTVEEMPTIAECTDGTMSGAICWIYLAWKGEP